MKSLGFKILVFIILCFIIDKGVGNFVENGALKYPIDDRLEKLINNELKKDLFVIGSSRAFNNINTGLISEKLNIDAYNLGFPGSTPEFHEFVFQMILKFNKDHFPNFKDKIEYIVVNDMPSKVKSLKKYLLLIFPGSFFVSLLQMLY